MVPRRYQPVAAAVSICRLNQVEEAAANAGVYAEEAATVREAGAAVRD